jgi:protein phosphatase 1K
LCLDAAVALESVHSAGLVFRDFKSANVLVDEAYCARLTDFGSVQDLAKGIEKEENEMGPTGGFHKRLMEGTTLLYAAPEVVSLESRNQLDLRSDVYSLGITMCELVTGQPPYEAVEKDDPAMNTVMDATYNEQSLLAAICYSHLRPPLDTVRFGEQLEMTNARALEAWRQLIRTCWAPLKENRPTCQQVVETLQSIIVQEFHIEPTTVKRKTLIDNCPAADAMNGNQAPPLKISKPSFPSPPADIHNRLSSDPKPLAIGSFATSGRRGPDKMEDRHAVTHAMLNDKTALTVITVLDGHGGQGAAAFCVKELGPAIHQAIPMCKSIDEEVAAVKQAFVDTDLRFQALMPDDTSGTTALAVLLFTKDGNIERTLVANAGDCRVVVGERAANTYSALRLTRDHNADQPAERARIVEAGGKIVVDANGNGRVQGHIQVSRSIGDTAMKPFGVSAEPEVDVIFFTPGEHDFLVIGTDGLFDFMKDDEVVRGVLDTAKEPGLASKRLGSDSISKGGTDNVTSVVVFMKAWEIGV